MKVGDATRDDSVEDVYRRDGNRLWWAVLAYSGDREVANDAVAEAFAQALHAWSMIRSPSHWIWRVAFRLAAAELKRRRRVEPLRETSYDMDRRAGELIEALARLSSRQRAAVVLHYYAGYPAKEVAVILGTSAATVGVHLHRARNRLRQLLEVDDA